VELLVGLLKVSLEHPGPLTHLVYQTDKLVYTWISQVAGLPKIFVVWDAVIDGKARWERKVQNNPSVGRVFFVDHIKRRNLYGSLKWIGRERT
jgi:hypothetical protein